MSASNWATTRFSTSPSTCSRFGAMASISSMKMMLGDFRAGLFKDLAQVGFALPVKLVDDFRAAHGEKLASVS